MNKNIRQGRPKKGDDKLVRLHVIIDHKHKKLLEDTFITNQDIYRSEAHIVRIALDKFFKTNLY